MKKYAAYIIISSAHARTQRVWILLYDCKSSQISDHPNVRWGNLPIPVPRKGALFRAKALKYPLRQVSEEKASFKTKG